MSASSAVRWTQAGAESARPQGGDRRSQRIEAFAGIIVAAVTTKIDITLVELVEMLAAEHGQRFAPSTLWRFLDRHGMTLKKNRARQRADEARRRRDVLVALVPGVVSIHALVWSATALL